jgi:ribosome-binding protein aMBF1 (putative translation factor)
MAKKSSGDVSLKLVQELRKDPGYRDFSDRNEFFKSVGTEIARIRKAKKMTSEELASKIGKATTAVSRMERGEFKSYTVKLLLDIAVATKTKLRLQFS